VHRQIRNRNENTLLKKELLEGAWTPEAFTITAHIRLKELGCDATIDAT